MSKSYVVTAPYVTLRVPDAAGQEVLRGFHQGAAVPVDVNGEDLDRHARKGMVAEGGGREAGLLGVPSGTPVPGEPPNVAVGEVPAGNVPPAERARRAQDAADEGRRGRRRAGADEGKA